MLKKTMIYFFCIQLFLPVYKVSAVETEASRPSPLINISNEQTEMTQIFESISQIETEHTERSTTEQIDSIDSSAEEELPESTDSTSYEEVLIETEETQEEEHIEEPSVEEKNETTQEATSSEIIEIPDPVLKEIINQFLGKEADAPINAADLPTDGINIIYEGRDGKKIKDLTGLRELAKHTTLARVRLPNNEVKDLTPIGGVPILGLTLSGNKIEDVTPLSEATHQYQELILSENQIKDFSPLGNVRIRTFQALDQQINIFELIEQSGELVMPEEYLPDGTQVWGRFKVPAFRDQYGNKLTLQNASSNISTHMYSLVHNTQLDTVSGGINTAVNSNGIFALEATSDDQLVSFYHESKKMDAPFAQAANIYGHLIELDRETNEIKITDFGLVQTIYGKIGTSQTSILKNINESRPITREVTLNFGVRPHNRTIYYEDMAIGDGFGLVIFEHHDIFGNKLKEDEIYLRAVGSNLDDLSFPDFDSYRLLTFVPPTVTIPPADEPLYWELVYGQVVELPDPILDREVRQTLAINEAELLDQDMQQLNALTYTGTDQTGRISDLTGLEFAHNLTELSLPHNAIKNVRPLEKLGKLTQLNLNENEDLSSIEQLPNTIRELQLSKTQIKEYAFLHNMKALRKLALANTNITNQELEQLVDVYPIKHNNLEYLDLRENQLSVLSLFPHSLTYHEVSSPDDFQKNTGVSLANQTLSLSKRITVGQHISILNPILIGEEETLAPLEDGSFTIEENQLIWPLQLDDEGNLSETEKQIQYGSYETTNYSAVLTVQLQYEPLKIDIPLQMEIEREGVSAVKGKVQYQINNRSDFPIKVTLSEVADNDEANELTLVEELTNEPGKIMLSLVSEKGKKINFSEKEQTIDTLEKQESLRFDLEGAFTGKRQTTSYDLNYQLRFHFSELER
ncbi:leucine-rich repeat domain-containing protein [Enterococcus mundtii]|uniref:Leucine-rich repeat domain-containing protein n=1 Tax=Enterococcus mundtii TaxID=53346 RepID=A0A242KG58_ENTMU|nr:leucine-rich repeat domain-containing protein [Enterococcus mundtii]OTP19936.1 hypothetical protein A5802_003340 [Enterococcus mundtii]